MNCRIMRSLLLILIFAVVSSQGRTLIEDFDKLRGNYGKTPKSPPPAPHTAPPTRDTVPLLLQDFNNYGRGSPPFPPSPKPSTPIIDKITSEDTFGVLKNYGRKPHSPPPAPHAGPPTKETTPFLLQDFNNYGRPSPPSPPSPKPSTPIIPMITSEDTFGTLKNYGRKPHSPPPAPHTAPPIKETIPLLLQNFNSYGRASPPSLPSPKPSTPLIEMITSDDTFGTLKNYGRPSHSPPPAHQESGSGVAAATAKKSSENLFRSAM